jgi:hypothetical protein
MDPIRFEKDLKVTIQTLGWKEGGLYQPLEEDIASVAFGIRRYPTQNFHRCRPPMLCSIQTEKPFLKNRPRPSRAGKLIPRALVRCRSREVDKAAYRRLVAAVEQFRRIVRVVVQRPDLRRQAENDTEHKQQA